MGDSPVPGSRDDPPASLRAEQVAQTRAALVHAGRQLFGTKGFAATSVEDIARAARVTTGALYHHFPTKAAVFEAVFEQVHAEMLVASVEAGLSLDAAVNRVTDELHRRYPDLADHLRVLTLELRAGRSRKDAWVAFAERLGLEEARSLATMLRQAEEMGTSLGETLAVFSDDMRMKRMLRAEEKAMALPAKMMLPLILFVFPCLIGVLMLPAIYRIKETLVK